MTDSDSLLAEPRSFGEAAAEDEIGADRVEDATAVSSGPGIAATDNGEADEDSGPAGALAGASGDHLDRTDDPMTLYLRDVGGKPLLTREGETALAKRIEAGRRTMSDGLGRSLPAIAAVSTWRDAIREGTLALRHVVDVAAVHGGARRAANGREGADGADNPHGEGEDAEAATPRLVAMEEAVLPAVMETLDRIAARYTKLRRLEEQRIELARRNRTLTASQASLRRRLECDLAILMESLRLTGARTEALVDDLRATDKRLRRCEGALLRLATGCGVPREAFLEQHEGRELESRWLSRVGRLRGEGWKTLAAKKRADALALRREILALARETATMPEDLGRTAALVLGGEREVQQATDEMIEANLRLAVSIAKKYQHSGSCAPRPRPGRQRRPDACGGQVRLPPGLQVLDLRDLVDPAVARAGGQRDRPRGPHPGAHGGDGEEGEAGVLAHGPGAGTRTVAGGDRGTHGHAGRQGAEGAGGGSGSGACEP